MATKNQDTLRKEYQAAYDSILPKYIRTVCDRLNRGEKITASKDEIWEKLNAVYKTLKLAPIKKFYLVDSPAAAIDLIEGRGLETELSQFEGIVYSELPSLDLLNVLASRDAIIEIGEYKNVRIPGVSDEVVYPLFEWFVDNLIFYTLLSPTTAIVIQPPNFIDTELILEKGPTPEGFSNLPGLVHLAKWLDENDKIVGTSARFNGIPIPENIILAHLNGTLDPARIFKEISNTEVQRAVIQMVGIENVIEHLDAEILDGSTTEGNTLYKISARIFNRPAFFIKHQCPSTKRVYFKAVKRQIVEDMIKEGKVDADAIQARRFGLSKVEYLDRTES